MPKRIKLNQFIRPSGNQVNELSIPEFAKLLEAHEGLIIVDNITYDSFTAGRDNIYFAYCFNYHTGKALTETLFIVDSITECESNFVISAQGKEYIVSLKE